MQVSGGHDPTRPVYLDCAATTPVDPEVLDAVTHYLATEYGNAGSRTHGYGAAANAAVENARRLVAGLVDATPDEVIFTSGATEANNLAILGLAEHGKAESRRHIVSTEIEHKSVLEPLAMLAKEGFEVELVAPAASGAVSADDVLARVRDDTLLVSVMHVNNETGIRQPIAELANGLGDGRPYLHVDAAQGFGKDLQPLRLQRIDLLTLSGHKLHAPKGVGALIARHRDHLRPPLHPLVYGGGQEHGLRSGTLPVHLIVGLGRAAQLAAENVQGRRARCLEIRERLLAALEPVEPVPSGDLSLALPHILNISFPGIDTEAVILVLKDVVAISNGSACTSATYEPSHVLRAMAVTDDQLRGAVRLSWCHLTPDPPYEEIATAIARLR